MGKSHTYHTLDINEIVSDLSTNLTKGLSVEDVTTLLEKYGKNVIADTKKASPLIILLKQFHNPMSYLLFLASGLSFMFQEWLDGMAILVVIVINSMIGFWMEWQAERSMNALKKMVMVTAKVLRNSEVIEIPSEDLVPGDVLLMEAGDMIAADARIAEATQLQTNESALTGESLPVEKLTQSLAEDTPLAERKNMLYKGTFVSNGNGRAVVTATGMDTELGHIASLVQSAQQSATPLEKKLQVFSKKLILITVVLVILIFFVGLLNNIHWLEMLETAIALTVAAIPEGLPIVATLALAQGMMKMAKHNVIVKKLSSVETLGGTNIICTDKTGTLTQNKIDVSILDFPGAWAEIKHIQNGHPIEFAQGDGLENNRNYERLKQIAILCNTAEYTLSEAGEKAIGDPLETGLLRFALHSGTNIQETRKEHIKVDELPFSSETKLMATKHQHNGGYIVSVKGAVEELLHHCVCIDSNSHREDFTPEQKQQWLDRADRLAEKGLRVLAFAWKETGKDNALMEQLVFTGIIGFIDPPAPGVQEAIAECKESGINVIMITGDHPSTALTIAKKLNLVGETDTDVINGKEMPAYNDLSENDKKRWLHTKVFARVSPAQKLDLVSVLQEHKNIVGMTGDGVNDAPALKKSDIGIAMGIRGTQVAQEVADMVLKDDSFASIIRAIKQGRIIFDNIRKFVIYLLSCNLSELFIVATVALLNLHFQLFPLQILFINLVTDVLPALALGVGRGSPMVMKQNPRHPDEPIITTRQWKSLWVYAGVMSLFTLGSVAASHYILHPAEPWNKELCNNILFLTLITSQLFHVFNMSFGKIVFYKNEVFTNKYIWFALLACIVIIFMAFIVTPIREVLHLYTVSFYDFITIFLSGVCSTLIVQLLKKLNWIE
ncbi:MAG: cation-translocating P-type ATPase [Flavobacteriales bacterium]